jgi:signal transduction histidine kinase
MLGKRSDQRGLFEADTVHGAFVGRESFYGFLAEQRGTLCRDEDFSALYCSDNGRRSVPPSLLATALVLQAYARVSDAEATERAAYDLRWKVALGIDVEARPFAKSTLQEFRAQLIVHEQQGALFQRSLALAQAQGRFKGRALRLAVDTTYILGRGAVQDTYNLLAAGIVLVLRVLGKQARQSVVAYAKGIKLERYVSGSSVKGQAELDWSDAAARRAFLQEIVADAERLLAVVREARAMLVAGSGAETRLVAAAGCLSRVLQQDLERKADGVALKDGVSRDRQVSVHDPEMRHGHKSARKRFDGHKASIAVDAETQLITAVDVLAGNAPDATGALALVEASEAATDTVVAETVGDCAYGDGGTRQAFADAGRTLVAKVATTTNQGRYPKTAFVLDLDADTCTCPAGQTVAGPARRDGRGRRVFRFAALVCAACPLRAQCVRGTGGRTIAVHPQERLLQAARALQASPGFRAYRALRQVAEHRLARLVQLGIRQARYVGRKQTLFQLLLAAAVANLTLLAHHPVTAGGDTDGGGPLLALSIALIALWTLTQSLRTGVTRRVPADRFPTVSGPTSPQCVRSLSKSPGSRPGF